MTIKVEQLSEAISAVPGISVEMLAAKVLANRSTTSTSYVGIGAPSVAEPGDIIGEFVAPIAGTYKLDAVATFYGSANWGYLRLVFDYDTTPIYAGGGDDWNVPAYGSDIRQYNFTDVVTLSAGVHKVKFEWKVINGTYGVWVADAPNWAVRGTLVSGSGAGGILLDSAAKTSDQTVAQDSDTVLTELALTFDAMAGEVVHVGHQICTDTTNDTVHTRVLLLRVDGGSWTPIFNEACANGMTFKGTTPLTLAAGQHTVEFGVRCDTHDFKVLGGDTDVFGHYPVSSVWVTQFRGGLVPIRQDGVDKVGQPRALDFIGAGVYEVVEGTGADAGVAKISMTAPVTAAGATVKYSDASPTAVRTYNGGTFADIDANLEQQFTVGVAGVYDIFISVAFVGNGGPSDMDAKLIFDESGFGGFTEQSLEYGKFSVPATGARATSTLYMGRLSLQAGTHKMKPQWKYFAGVELYTDTITTYLGWAVLSVGSGAGGTLVDEQLMTGGDYDPTASWTDVPGMSITFDAAPDERVLMSVIGRMVAGTLGTTDVRWNIDSGTTMVPANAQGYGASGDGTWSQNLSSSIFSPALTAGSHTIKLQAKRNNAAVIQDGAKIQITRFRGGLVPIRSDGQDVYDKPAALNFIGADVSEAGGQVSISLPAAVTAPGDAIVLSDGVPSSNLLVNSSGDHQIMPETGSLAFQTLMAGVYTIQFSGELIAPSSNSSGQIKLVFDEGEVNEQTIGYNEQWQTRPTTGTYTEPVFRDVVTLTAGNHTVKAYGTLLSGGGWQVSAAVDHPPVLMLTAVSGSGAGGVLGQIAAGSALPQTIDTAYNTTGYEDVVGCSITQEVSAGDRLQINVQAWGLSAGNPCTLKTRVELTGPSTINVPIGQTSTGTTSTALNVGGSALTPELLAGTYTIKFQAAKYSTQANWTMQEASLDVSLFRGGLVPIRHDGATVIDKPAAIDFVGPGCQVTNVGGTAKVALTGAEGMSITETTLASDFSTASTSYVDIDNGGGDALELDINVVHGERVMAWLEGYLDPSGNPARLEIQYNFGGQLVPAIGVIGESNAAGYSIGGGTYGPVASPALSAGTITVKAQLKVSANTGIVRAGAKLVIAQYKGGYVHPENVPKLVYNSASLVSIAARNGASNALQLTLNDGARYKATSPLTVDLAADGLGGLDTGSEAVSTWYYIYAVPSATIGVFSVIASISDPSTGPTGYPIWKYLGPARNDSSGDLLDIMDIGGGSFTYKGRKEPASSPGVDSTQYTPAANRSIADYVPATADHVNMSAMLLHKDGSGNNAFMEAYSKGQTETIVFITTSAPYNNFDMSFDVPIPDMSQSFDYRCYDNGGTAIKQQSYYVHGFRDAFLAQNNAQAQARFEPDTYPPKGEWKTAATVDFYAHPGQPTTIRMTLQDGVPRSMSGTKTWAIANGVADLGYDHADSQGNSKWLYFYLVPKSGADSEMTIRASDNPPSVGPTGYTNFMYVWSTYINSSGNLIHVIQNGDEFFFNSNADGNVYAGNGAGYIEHETAYANVDLSAHVPETAGSMHWRCYADIQAENPQGYWIIHWSLDGTNTFQWLNPRGDITVSQNEADSWPMPVPSNRIIKRMRSRQTGALDIGFIQYGVISWTDEWLVAPTVSGGLGAGGSGSPSEMNFDELSSTGTETYIALSKTPVDSGGGTPAKAVQVFRNGIRMKYVASLGSDNNEWTYNGSLNRVEFVASGTSDYYTADFLASP